MGTVGINQVLTRSLECPKCSGQRGGIGLLIENGDGFPERLNGPIEPVAWRLTQEHLRKGYPPNYRYFRLIICDLLACGVYSLTSFDAFDLKAASTPERCRSYFTEQRWDFATELAYPTA